jgi:hypothetical protein
MFAKLFASITESSLWSEPKEVRLLFVSMLARADQAGFVEAAIPGLARLANLTIEETESALQCLMSPDKYSKNTDFEGRRIAPVDGGYLLLNYESYRSKRDEEQRREYMRQYMAEYRRSGKQPVSTGKQSKSDVSRGKPQLAQAEAEAEAEAEANTKNTLACSQSQSAAPTRARRSSVPVDDPTFGEFWAIYPRREAKGNAIKAWAKAISEGVARETILKAVATFRQRCAGQDPKFIAHPASWLNARRWEDEPVEPIRPNPLAWQKEMFRKFNSGEITEAEFNAAVKAKMESYN